MTPVDLGDCVGWIGRPGGDLLSRALRHSTMGAGDFHVRVRDGIGCRLPAKATRSSSLSSCGGLREVLVRCAAWVCSPRPRCVMLSSYRKVPINDCCVWGLVRLF